MLARSAAKIELPPIALQVTVAQAWSGCGEAVVLSHTDREDEVSLPFPDTTPRS